MQFSMCVLNTGWYLKGEEGEFPRHWSDPNTTAQLFPISSHATAKLFPLTGFTYTYKYYYYYLISFSKNCLKSKYHPGYVLSYLLTYIFIVYLLLSIVSTLVSYLPIDHPNLGTQEHAQERYG